MPGAVTALEDLRSQLNTNRGDKPKLTILPLLITAICKTLPDFPMINARYDDEAGMVTRAPLTHDDVACNGLLTTVKLDAESFAV